MRKIEKIELTNQLINLFESDNNIQASVKIRNNLIEIAMKNKVLLQLLRILNINDYLRFSQEKAFSSMLQVIETLSKCLKDCEYAFFKLIKPIVYVPADVDLLVSIHHVKKTIKLIERLGYNVITKDPYCVTLSKGHSIIDLYTYPSLGGVAFIDGQKLLEHSRKVEFNGIEVKSLEPYAEAVVVAAHAIYKERIYTLNDYFTLKKTLSKRSFELAKGLHCEESLKLIIAINRNVDEGLLGLPYKIPIALWFKLMTQKLYDDKLTKTTLINLIKTLFNQRFGKQLLAKLTGESY